MTDDDRPFGISYTKLGSFRRCKLQYHRQYVQGYFPKPSMGQARGTAGHAALAVWHTTYDEQASIQTAWDTWTEEGQVDGKDWDLLEQALNRYYDYSLQSKDEFVIQVAEQKFEITYELEGGRNVLFNGYIDGIVEEKGRIWLLENKFYKVIESRGLEMDGQVSLYLLASHLLNYNADGVIYNMVRVADTKVAVTEPVVRRRITRNPQGLDAIQSEMLLQAQEMIRYHQEGGKPYRNVTKTCQYDCSFYHACLAMLDDGQENDQILASISKPRR